MNDSERDASLDLIAAAEKIGAKLHAVLMVAAMRKVEHCEYAAYFLCTIAECFDGALALAKSPAQSHALGLFRSMLEAFIDLKVLADDPAYLDQLKFADAVQLAKVCKGYESIPDMEKEQLRQVAGWAAEADKDMKALELKGVKKLSIRDRFKRAGRDDLYGTAYGFFCQTTHNNLVTLRARHAGMTHLRLGYPVPLTTLRSTLTLAIGIYVQAMQLLPKISAIDEKVLAEACGELESIWAAVLKRHELT